MFEPLRVLARHVVRLLATAADRDPTEPRLAPGESVLIEPIMGPPKE